MIDFIAKLEGMLKTSGCEDYEIHLMDSWKKSPTINLSKSINISKGETTNA